LVAIQFLMLQVPVQLLGGLLQTAAAAAVLAMEILMETQRLAVLAVVGGQLIALSLAHRGLLEFPGKVMLAARG
jgi:hypothetical protein